jgi:Zn-dependent protease
MNFSLMTLQYILFGIASFIIAGSLHEYAHAFSAFVLGDDTARMNGRMTLNPAAHVDVWGTIVFPLIGAVSGLPVIGWMKPVPVNPNHFRKPSRDDALCAFAGPFSNLLQASFIIIVIKLFQMIVYAAGLSSNIVMITIYEFLMIYFTTNICLMIFNLFPIPPLDGSWILRHFIPDEWKDRFDSFSRYGFIILYLLVVSRAFSILFNPLVDTVESVFITLMNTNLFLVSLPFILLTGITLYFLRDEVTLFLHRIKHRSTLSILRGEKKEQSPVLEPATGTDDSLYSRQSEEYINEAKARSAWKTCDMSLFDKQRDICIKCDNYVKCLSKSLREKNA